MSSFIKRAPIEVGIYPMTYGDIPDVFYLESQAREHPWQSEDFEFCLGAEDIDEDNDDQYVLEIATYREEIVGFIVFYQEVEQLRIFNINVASHVRRRTIATQMIQRVHKRLHKKRRVLIAMVPDSNLYLPAQKCFAKNEFRALVPFKKDFYVYEDSQKEDAIPMRYVKPLELKQNRIKRHLPPHLRGE